MFFHQKGLLFIGLYFILNMTSLFLFDTPKNPDIELNSAEYSYYLNQVNGPYSEKKERFFVNESKKISDANVALEKIYNDYYDGGISEHEMLSVERQLEEIVENERGFKVIFDQYTYVRENPDNRYFLYANGWDGLLATDNLDLLFLLLLLVLITPVFSNEYASEMDSLHLTVRKGTRVHAASKIVLVLMTVIVLCFMSSLLRYGFFQLKYGLEDGNYPLQSLAYFGSSTKNITLLTTFISLTVIKTMGNISFAILIMLFSVWSKRYAMTLFFSTAVILLPYYGSGVGATKYLFPGPLGFMISTGFFKGSESEYNIVTDQMDVIFEEISTMTTMTMFTITFCISIGAIIMIFTHHTNVWSVRKRGSGLKISSILLFLSIALASLTGCNSIQNTDDYNIYNYSSRQSFENEQYRFYVDETDYDNIRLVFEDKKTSVIKNLVRSPLQSLVEIDTSIYGNGEYVYYIKKEFDKLKGFAFRNEEHGRFFIIEVNTTTFDERIIFEKNINSDEDNFLGIHSADVSDSSLYFLVDSFFLDEQNVYFIESDKIRQVNKLTGKSTVIISAPLLTSVAFDGQTIYYLNEKYQVVQYDTKTDSEKALPDIVTTNFLLTDKELLFLNRKDQYKIYAMNLDNFTIRKITEKSVLTFTCDDQYIYFEDRDDIKSYRIDFDGEGEVLMSE